MNDIHYTLTGCLVLVLAVAIAIIPVSLFVYVIGQLINYLTGV